MSLNETPSADRIHIGFFGKRNSGKSSLINAVTGQEVAIVSEVAGTTTDPVYKPMEIHGIGACLLIDTAGFDDEGALGLMRVEKTKLAAEKTDIAVLLFSDTAMEQEIGWYRFFQERNKAVLCVVSRPDRHTATDRRSVTDGMIRMVEEKTGQKPIAVDTGDSASVSRFKEALIRTVPESFGSHSITGSLVGEGDVVLLVMPQDIQAPKGRLILPQVQTIRDLLDNKCVVVSVSTDKLDAALAALGKPPKLIITDSQVFRLVYEKKPPESRLTSFSVLFAAHKGDLPYYLEGAAAVDRLTESSRVLVAECCTHAPLTEDIGREKIPRMLKKRIGAGLRVDIVSGTDYPADLRNYDLIIQCGACMFNRTYVLSRIDRAKEQGVPMTNYGVVIAYLSGILDQVSY